MPNIVPSPLKNFFPFFRKASTIATKDGLESVIGKLLENLKRYPQDKRSILVTNFITILVGEVLLPLILSRNTISLIKKSLDLLEAPIFPQKNITVFEVSVCKKCGAKFLFCLL
jgi:hypothetical protein